ncbi:DUF6585 family protein [Saccharothrix obliqua]|uniref:DUF6585 family protein n=1 Tax=Saccharothrix obliqua TaxID=2861747 RepID=UPI001C5F382D|nr:DUF6585 family protein [Saccharothrix obliqua]MBW4720306.1 hypothetical protein [Saccharothrix obliqua]
MLGPSPDDEPVPLEVAHVAGVSRLGDVLAVHRVRHRVLAADEVAKAKRRQLRNGVLALVGVSLPLLVMVVIWWATGIPGLAVGVGVAVLAVGVGVFLAVLFRDDKSKVDDRHRVYVHRDGFVLPGGGGGPRAFRWDDFTAVHRVATDTYVNGQHAFTGYVFRLVREDGTHVVFEGGERQDKPLRNDILDLGPVLEEQVANRRLPIAVAEVNAGRPVEFGALTVTAAAVATPKGVVPWQDVDVLSIGGGHLFLGARGGTPATYPIGDIPNFPVFWTLAQNLRAHHAV